MNAQALTANEVALRLLAEGVAPDCAVACAAKGAAWVQELGGATELLFDLASLTKPMTAAAVARAGIDRQTPLGALLAEARGTPSEHVPLELFLAHRAGLDAHRALYAPLVRGETVGPADALREAANARRGDALGPPPPEGFPPLYSDLGYLLVGEALARSIRARDAGEAIARLVLAPLGIEDCAGTVRDLEARGVRGPFAPTEFVAWRGGLLQGFVHDENAWAITGNGGSGHAGVFGTVAAVLTFGRAVIDALDWGGRGGRGGRGGPVGDVDLEWLVSRRPGGDLRAGFDGKAAQGSSAGPSMSEESFGHLGFTGTSLWIDPDARVVVTVLTNRVCPSRDHFAIRAARPWAHDALWSRALALALER